MHHQETATRPRLLTVAASLLLVLAASKIAWLALTLGQADRNDPVFGLSYRFLSLVAAPAELAVGLLLLLTKSHRLHSLALLATGGIIVLYRCALARTGVLDSSCQCLGILQDYLPFSPRTMDAVLMTIGFWFWASGLLLALVASSPESPDSLSHTKVVREPSTSEVDPDSTAAGKQS